ncbi:MAG: hypothetical protein ACYTDY_01120 [Planctomycetota bacterium]|jgi:hypothetical protein
MLTRALPVLLLAAVLLACSDRSPSDFVLYKAVPTEMEGRLRSGTLLVTGEGTALWVEHGAEGRVTMGEGTVGDEDWAALLDALEDAASRPRSGRISESGPGPFQVYARVAGREIELLRDPTEGVEEEVAAVRDGLEAIRRSLSPPEDPVDAAAPLLLSPLSHVRGHGAVALLMLFRDARESEDVRTRARSVLREHLLREGDSSIAERIRDALKRRKTPFLPNPRQK